MTTGVSLGSLTQNNAESSDSFDQEGQELGTWNQLRDSLGQQKPKKKKVTFSKETLAAYQAKQQEDNKQNKGSHPGGLQLEQLRPNNQQQSWYNAPRRMQQQTATASEKKLEHRPCNHYNLDSEEGTLGSLEQNASTTNLRADRSPKLNNNTSILGQDLKNTAAWGILVDTGAAVSLAPVSFAPETELSPLKSTLKLRTVTGKEIQAFGCKTVHLVGRELSLTISFVIADVEHVVLGLDVLLREQLSMLIGNNGEINLVNKVGAKTELQQRGHLLYIEACSTELGLSTCRGSSLPQNDGSLLDDKNGTHQDAALQRELANQEVTASGGASGSSFSLQNLSQHKNTTSLGATALPKQGAKRNKKKKPSARRASHNQLDETSSKQEGQQPAAAQLRTWDKTSLIAEIELAAGEPTQTSFSKIDQQELSMRILLIVSLRYKWQLVTTRTTTACSEELLGQQLRSIGLDQNQLDRHIFSGDELLVMLCDNDLLLGGTERQQELFFIELSACTSLEKPTKLAHNTPIIFANKIVEWNEASNSISLGVPSALCKELLERHQLQDAESITSLQQEELGQEASEQNIALDADPTKLYQRTVGDLALAAACRPDLCFEIHMLTQSLTTPTREQEMQLHKVLRYLRGTQHYTLSLHPTNQMTQERASSLNLVAFSASSWTTTCQSTSTAYLTLWGAPVIASFRTSCAYTQADAELDSVQLALQLACRTKSLLQQLSVEQLVHKQVNISLRTSSWHDELVTGRPLAMQLGLSRKNKRIQLRALHGQLHLSKVIPDKNLATSLANIASDSTRVLAKLRVLTEEAKIIALTTVRGQGLASFGFSSSLVGGVIAETPAMASHQLRQLDLRQSDYESFSRTCFERSSLTLHSLSFQKSDPESFRPCFERQSLTLHSLSLAKASLQNNSFESLTETSLSLSADNSDSLILPSCSLQSENAPSLTLQSLSFRSDSLEENEEQKAHSFAQGGAGTNSFPQDSLQEELSYDELTNGNAQSGAGKNSFTYKSFLDRIVSLQMRLRIFLLVSFQLACAALFLVTSSVTTSFQSFSAQLYKSNLDSLINQLDLRISLSLTQFGSTTACRSQLQNKFQTEQLVQQQLPGNTALAIQLQHDNNKHIELAKRSFEHHQLQSNNLETEKQNKQLQEQPASNKHHRQLHLHQLPLTDQPFNGPKQLSKKPCFTACPSGQLISSFSKQKLERLTCTRSILEHDQHTQQLHNKQSEQLCEDHLTANSFHKNKQQQQLIQQSFDNKMKKKQLSASQSQLRPEQPNPAYSRLSLQQLTPSNSLESFQLPSSALLLATLVEYILVGYEHKSFQLTLQQLCFSKAQWGELQGAFLPACCTTLRLTALTLMSLSFAVAWLKPFRLASRRRRRALRKSASNPTTLTRRAAWNRATFATKAWTSTTYSIATWSTIALRTSASRRTTSSKPTCRMTAWQTTSWRRTSSSTSSSTASTSALKRTRSLKSTPWLSIFLISFSSNKDIDSSSFLNNEFQQLVQRSLRAISSSFKTFCGIRSLRSFWLINLCRLILFMIILAKNSLDQFSFHKIFWRPRSRRSLRNKS